jgi:hypothetical protein
LDVIHANAQFPVPFEKLLLRCKKGFHSHWYPHTDHRYNCSVQDQYDLRVHRYVDLQKKYLERNRVH